MAVYDKAYLEERIAKCRKFLPRFKELITAHCMPDLSKGDEVTIAPVKVKDRAVVKLLEYITETMKESLGEVKSSVMKVKDVLRCSVKCRTAADSKRIFKNLTRDNAFFRVFRCKNDFNNPNKKATD